MSSKKSLVKMQRFLLVLSALTFLLVSCPDPSSSGKRAEPVKPTPKASVVFDNTYGVCTAVVYDDYRRRGEDKIAEVPAGQRSTEIELPPSVSEPFYFAYLLNLNGVSDYTVNYVPKNGKDQKAVRLDANTKNIVIIPKFDETFSSEDQLLSSRSSLLLQNASSYSFELHRGRSSVPPDGKTSSPTVNSWEKAFYTINTSDVFAPSAKVVSNYHLLVGADYKDFPASPDRFEPGHFYSYTYLNDVNFISDIPIKFDNVIVKTYTVSFNVNGGNGTAPVMQTAKAGSVTRLPEGNGLTKTGYTFGGWNASASGAEINYSAGADYLATGDITLYAKWYPLGTVTYTVTFDSNGGSVAVTQYMASGIAAFRPINPIKTGYVFVDWYGDLGLTTVYDFATPVTGNVTLYAKWDVNRQYTVTFNANGANGSVPAAQTVNTGAGIVLPGGTGLSKAGHVFGGWCTDDTGTETTYDPGTPYMVSGDITLFAKWTATVTEPQPGTEIVVPEGGTIIHISTQTGLESIRSHIDSAAHNYGKNAYVLDNDLTLSGTWTPIGYAETVDYYGRPTSGIHAFKGNFYGNGHTIRNMVLPGDIGTNFSIGLFGYTDGALIQDLEVELGTATIMVTSNSGTQKIGIIVGANKNSVIKNCGVYSPFGITVNNSSAASVHVGGISDIADESTNSIIENCYVSMNITVTSTGTWIAVGGVAAYSNIIRNCYYMGTITASGSNASLYGVIHDPDSVEKSYSTGKIINNATGSAHTANSGIGRLGYISNCATLIEKIDVSYGTGYARKIQYNNISGPVTLTNNYAYSGMLLNDSTVTSNDPNSQNGLDKTAAELKQRSTYETGLGWDFTNVWEMGPSSYPFPILKWQNGVIKLPQGFMPIGQRETVALSVANVSELNSALSTAQSGPSETNFVITVTSDLNLSPQPLTLAAYKNKTVTLKGNTADRKITLSSQGSLFTVGENVELVLESITLQGRSDNNASLITVDGGNLILNTGSKITGNSITVVPQFKAGGITVKNNSMFTMNSGEISDNTIKNSRDTYGGAGGLYIDNSTFIMNGGKISNNKATSDYASSMVGGVHIISNSVFTMNNGDICDNEYNYTWGNTVSAGGMLLDEDSIFYMHGGKITRNISSGPTSSTWGKEAGGIMIRFRGAFYMYGGEVSANKSVTHNYSAGGVCIEIESNGVFIKTGGIVYGSDAEESLRNTTKRSDGAAIYASENEFGKNAKSRNKSLYESNNFDSTMTGSAGGWE